MTGPDPTHAQEQLVSARILVIDDEPANTTILTRLLTQAGYTAVEAVNDAHEAMARYEALGPDLVLLDLHMPHRDGFEMLAEMADPEQSAIRPPVIVLTADVTRVARERALSLGAADFLTKPLDHLEALLRIRSHLATRYLELRLAEQNAALEQLVAKRTADLRTSLDQLRETAEHRRLLLTRLVTAQEEERRRIAGDIHDDTVQTMVAVGFRLELLKRQLADPGQRVEMEALQATVSDALSSLRRLLFDLLPASLETEGLASALRQQLDRLAEESGPAGELVDELARPPSHETAVVLFRIAQEALVNVGRHAAASRVTVTLGSEGGGVSVEVRDDGRGFRVVDGDDGAPGAGWHLGLPSIRERAEIAGGWCRIESRPGSGTVVTAWVPLHDEPAGEPGGD
jgi:signal transduction histidine kinase